MPFRPLKFRFTLLYLSFNVSVMHVSFAPLVGCQRFILETRSYRLSVRFGTKMMEISFLDMPTDQSAQQKAKRGYWSTDRTFFS